MKVYVFYRQEASGVLGRDALTEIDGVYRSMDLAKEAAQRDYQIPVGAWSPEERVGYWTYSESVEGITWLYYIVEAELA